MKVSDKSKKGLNLNMKFFSLNILFCLLFSSLAYTQDTCKLTNAKLDPTLKENESRLGVLFLDPLGHKINGDIILIVDRDSLELVVDSLGTINMVVEPGRHSLQFLSKYMKPLLVDSLEFKPRFNYQIQAHFDGETFVLPQIIFEYDKPVIYFYPEKETQVNVSIDFDGELGFCYPKYDNGWKFTVKPNGELEVDNVSYRYLFWEGATEVPFSNEIYDSGFIVSSDSTLMFLEKSLTTLGFNSYEIQDFVTYWVPQMQKNESNFIHFLIGSEYDEYAALNISPKPDHLMRVFMLWTSVSKLEIEQVSPQLFPSFSRTGFHVMEWGGSELNPLAK